MASIACATPTTTPSEMACHRWVLGAVLASCALVGGILCWGYSWLTGPTPRGSATTGLWRKDSSSQGSRPIVFMHGLGGSAADFDQMISWVQRRWPGRPTVAVPLYEMGSSASALTAQLPEIAHWLSRKVQQTTSMQRGYDLVCHSQGALLCRCLVEYLDDHKVHTLVSLAGPHMGVFGTSLAFNAAGILTADLGNLAYSGLLQASSSIANMWHDPTREDEYLEKNVFLPLYNGLTDDAKGNDKRKANFLRLERAVFLVGRLDNASYEGGIEPFQSGVFGFYKSGSTTDVIPMEQTKEFKEDTFGLRTLQESGKLVTRTVPGIKHNWWLSERDVVEQHVFPHLDSATGSRTTS